MAASKPNAFLENPQLARSPVVQYLEFTVPTPFFSGWDPSFEITAISFAPKTIEFATIINHGTLISDFNADPQVLRDCDDAFPTEDFAQLVLTVCDVHSHLTSFTHPPHPHPVARPRLGVESPHVKHRREQEPYLSQRIGTICCETLQLVCSCKCKPALTHSHHKFTHPSL
jgi:hypothetical protein